jgi:hypothetical protein
VIITAENYFSTEAELAYMGSTQFKRFMECPARAMAMLHGEWEEETSTALLVGSYVDAYFSNELPLFKAHHPSIFTQKGELKADYKHAEYIIQRIQRDEMFMKYLSGGSQSIMTGSIAGVPFKIKIDSYHIGRAIVDLKIVKDFSPVWDEQLRRKVPFVEAWGYDYQAAIYQTVEGHSLPFMIAAATKEKPEPNIAIISIPQERIDYCSEIIQASAPEFAEIKRGNIPPRRCEKCDYCKATKTLTQIIDYREIA